MSDYLGILARRAISAPALRPRPRSRFEEGLGVEAALPEQPVSEYQPNVSPAPAVQASLHAAPADRPTAQAPVPPAVPSPVMAAAAITPLAAPIPLVRAPLAEPLPPAPPDIRVEVRPQLAAVAPLAPAGVAPVPAAAIEAAPLVPAALAPLPLLQGESPRHPRPALETVTRLMMSAPLAGAAPASD
jgi:hypothetical protein